MLFDSSALVIGLIASYVAEWPASHTFSMGFKRVEVISGFVNGVFLVFVGVSVAMEAIERMREPPDVSKWDEEMTGWINEVDWGKSAYVNFSWRIGGESYWIGLLP